MNTTVIVPEVQVFLAAVETHLADLDADERREILDGLEADLGELVAEHGPSALGDPGAYAAELRAAAGIGAEVPTRTSVPVHARVTALLDSVRERFDAAIGLLPADVRPLLSWARPLWWVGRAWVAATLLGLFIGTGEAGLVPSLRHLGWPLLLVSVVVSVQIGRGRLWPGRTTGLPSRLLLLALNTFALVVAVPVVSEVSDSGPSYATGWSRGYTIGVNEVADANQGPKKGLYRDGLWVSNIYPYDAHGRPLVGVQLFDQTGKPLNVITQPEYADAQDGETVQVDPETGQELPRIYYPWTNGATQLYNVFPLPSRIQDSEQLSPNAFAEKDRPKVGTFPLDVVVRAFLPGIHTGVQR